MYREKFGTSKDDTEREFMESTLQFEKQCKKISHLKCSICKQVRIGLDMSKSNSTCKRNPTCVDCNLLIKEDISLPTWTDTNGDIHYEVPKELACLREGEKLLIQKVDTYVPMLHLQYGQLGMRGHVCSFPKDLSGIVHDLPRLPSQVTYVRVIKHYQIEKGEELGTKAFVIRRKEVIKALQWLKVHNIEYKDINILPKNFDWMGNATEEELPCVNGIEVVEALNGNRNDNSPQCSDMGPCGKYSENQEKGIGAFGMLPSNFKAMPGEKDREVVETIERAVNDLKGKKEGGPKYASVSFPYITPRAVIETARIFVQGFPWLFPGGKGDVSDTSKLKGIHDWMKRLLYYQDGRFSKDKIWCFFALNFAVRKENQQSGGFFVDRFYAGGPKTIEELQQQILDGDTQWIDRICYFTKNVIGSPSYWRLKRRELFSWINHHIEEGHGPPTFFITLSCAEYQWKDVKRLVKERILLTGGNDEWNENRLSSNVNEYCIVVQEYFQEKVKIWLNTVGAKVFGIKHYWYRFEFAPSRGQIHAHMLAISDSRALPQKYYDLRPDKQKQAKFLEGWVQTCFNMTTSKDASISISETAEHPSSLSFDQMVDRKKYDENLCLTKLQQHVCSKYCLKKMRYVKKLFMNYGTVLYFKFECLFFK